MNRVVRGGRGAACCQFWKNGAASSAMKTPSQFLRFAILAVAMVARLHTPLLAEEKPARELPLQKHTPEENEQLGKAEADFKKANDLWNYGGRSPEALKLFRPALAVLKHLVGPEDAELVQRRTELAHMLSRTSAETQAEAADEYRAVIAIRDRINGPKDESTLFLRVCLADALASQQKFDESAKELKAVIPVMESVFGPAKEDTLHARHRLAGILEGQRKSAESEKEYRGILAAMCRAVGPENEEKLDEWELTNQGSGDWSHWLGGLGKSEEAENEYLAALAVFERVVSRERRESVLFRRNLFALQINLAACLEAQGKFQEALVLLKQIAERQATDSSYGDAHGVQMMRNRIVEVLIKQREALAKQSGIKDPVPLKKGELDMSILSGLEECGMTLTEVTEKQARKPSTVDYPFLGHIPVRAKTYILQAKSLGYTDQRWTLYWTHDGAFIGAVYTRPGFSTKWDRKHVEDGYKACGEKIVGLPKERPQIRFQNLIEVIKHEAWSQVVNQVRIRRVIWTTSDGDGVERKHSEIYAVTVWSPGVMITPHFTGDAARIMLDKDGNGLFVDNGL